MTAFDRKLKRNASKKMAKELKKNLNNILSQQIEEKMKSFRKIPEECQLCSKSFDKTSREQAFSWMMKVSEEDDTYNLYCPDCYDSAVAGGAEDE